MTLDYCPKLRPIHPQPAVAQGQPILLLQDPLQLAETAVFMPQVLAPVLAFCDGTRNLNELRATLIIRAGISLSVGELEYIVARLDQALLLENDRSAAALWAAVESFRALPFRPPTLAGNGYPAEPKPLCVMLDGYLAALPDGRPSYHPLRGLVSPHIDYQRGGPVYARVWQQAAQAVREAEVVVILGTDHNGGLGRITLTRQNYATPYGVLPTDTAVVDAIAQAIGEQAAFGEELHHRTEHSIELAAVWLHHMRGGEACAVVPILTGSFYHFVQAKGAAPAEDSTIAQTMRVLQRELQGRAAVVVAAGDLAHIGPAFGDPRPVDMVGKAQLQAQDEQLMHVICSGDAEAFFQTLRAEQDQRNVCGLPPIYLMLRLLENAQGEPAGYDRCPADAHHTSFVSICGIVFG